MKVEVVKRPTRLSKSNSNWLQVVDKFHILEPSEVLRITGLSPKESNALRQQAYREDRARCFVRIENGKQVLYLYRRSE